jgi:hypothetical protein
VPLNNARAARISSSAQSRGWRKFEAFRSDIATPLSPDCLILWASRGGDVSRVQPCVDGYAGRRRCWRANSATFMSSVSGVSRERGRSIYPAASPGARAMTLRLSAIVGLYIMPPDDAVVLSVMRSQSHDYQAAWNDNVVRCFRPSGWRGHRRPAR